MKIELFNQEALQKMQSPDDLDQLLVVVTPKSWLLILTVAGLSLAALAWSVFGRIPITVDGYGVLISPGNVKGVQAKVSAQVTQVLIRVGQHVEQNQVVAEVSQPALQQQLEQAEDKLNELRAFDKTARRLDIERLELEDQALQKQIDFINKEIERSRGLAEKTDKEARTSIDKQSRNLQRAEKLLSELRDSLTNRVKTIRQLRADGLTSEDSVLSARSAEMESQLKVANIEVQLQDLVLLDIRREQTELQTQSRLADLQLQLLQLPIKKMQIETQIMQSQQTRKSEIDELDDRIAGLKLRLQDESEIRSLYSGRILELAVSPGQMVHQGMRLATIAEDQAEELKNIAYFKIRDGKRIRKGDRILVTPTNIE
ncbi:MAG: NHLP bacteriocin system secretion protein, partial [Planctomycetes bacterium]|nr:NHLP bacteriocin system secretion protein [Planctomycetota bacterium]